VNIVTAVLGRLVHGSWFGHGPLYTITLLLYRSPCLGPNRWLPSSAVYLSTEHVNSLVFIRWWQHIHVTAVIIGP